MMMIITIATVLPLVDYVRFHIICLSSFLEIFLEANYARAPVAARAITTTITITTTIATGCR